MASNLHWGESAVLVKNTFLDVACDDNGDPLSPPQLERSRTTPAPSSKPMYGADTNTEENRRIEPILERAASGSTEEEQEGEEDRVAPLEGVEVPTSGLSLTRCITRDIFEPQEDWDWAGTAQVSAPSCDSMAAAGAMGAGGTMPGMGMPMQQGNMAFAPIQGQAMPMVAQPMCYQAMPGGGMVMQPILVPVGMQGGVPAPMPGGAHPGAGGYQQQNVPTPSTSSGGGSPSAYTVPPPPGQQPDIERVPSTSGPAPQFSPTWNNAGGGGMAASLKAAAGDEGSSQPASTSRAASGALPQAGDITVVSAAPPQPQTLSRSQSSNTSSHRIHWHVDARKLKGNDKQAVSPAFELDFGLDFKNVTFKMMVYPKVVSETKGGASFKKAKGNGFVQLKCEAELTEDLANVAFRIGCGEEAKVSGNRVMRGPNHHNFSHSAVCGLPKDKEEWDFTAFVNPESQTFLVVLEIQPLYQ